MGSQETLERNIGVLIEASSKDHLGLIQKLGAILFSPEISGRCAKRFKGGGEGGRNQQWTLLT